MVAVITSIIAREKIFEHLPLVKPKFIPFIKKVQDTYNKITYHNKTHATDLA